MLRDKFKADVLAAIEICYEIGYAPTRFEQMIRDAHPVEVAKGFVVSGEFQYGFKEILKLNRKELTIESLMLEPDYADLFTKQELDAARWRLEHG